MSSGTRKKLASGDEEEKKSFSGSLIPNLRVIILDFKINNNENVCGGAISFVKEKKTGIEPGEIPFFLLSLSLFFLLKTKPFHSLHMAIHYFCVCTEF